MKFLTALYSASVLSAMVSLITQGIRVSVSPHFVGRSKLDEDLVYAFRYSIQIENLSATLVRLESRFWNIYDVLSPVYTVEGPGVVGQHPVLNSGDIYSYESGCYLKGEVGAMSGFYIFQTLDNFSDLEIERIRVDIPSFQLVTPASQN